VEREVAALCDLRQEVNSGGFDSYFRYWGCDTANEALAALPTVLGQAWADLLAEAMELLGPDYPADIDARHDRLDGLHLDEALDALDARFYEPEDVTDADNLMSAYLAR
jgi:hypothetical protein